MSAMAIPKKTRGRPRTEASDRGQTVQSLDRALLLLQNIAGSEEATLTELALRTGMAPSTAHRLLSTLERHGFVSFDEMTQHWKVGVEAFRVGSAFLRSTRLMDAAKPVMRDLMRKTGETCNLGIADNGEVVFVFQVETQAAIRASFPTGTRAEMHSSGIGKALLAQYQRKHVEGILKQKGLPQFTDNTITSAAGLFDDLDSIRIRGWSIDDEERNVGMRCLAAPIFDMLSVPIAGLSISGPRARLSDEKLREYGPLVKRLADRLTLDIGGKKPERPSS